MFVLALPLQSGSNLFTIVAFAWCVSAATAMASIGRALSHGVELFIMPLSSSGARL